MAGYATTAAAAAAVVAINGTISLLRLCLSAPPSQFQGVEVRIGVDLVWKLIAPAIAVAVMVVATFTVFIGITFDLSDVNVECSSNSSSSCKMYNVTSNQTVIREDRIVIANIQ